MKIEKFYEKYGVKYTFRKSLKAGFIDYLRVENDQADVDEKVLIEKYKAFTGVDPTTGKVAEKQVHQNPTTSAPASGSEPAASTGETSTGEPTKETASRFGKKNS